MSKHIRINVHWLYVILIVYYHQWPSANYTIFVRYVKLQLNVLSESRLLIWSQFSSKINRIPQTMLIGCVKLPGFLLIFFPQDTVLPSWYPYCFSVNGWLSFLFVFQNFIKRFIIFVRGAESFMISWSYKVLFSAQLRNSWNFIPTWLLTVFIDETDIEMKHINFKEKQSLLGFLWVLTGDSTTAVIWFYLMLKKH